MKIYTITTRGQLIYTCVDRRMAEDYIHRYKRDNNALLIDSEDIIITDYATAEQCWESFKDLDKEIPQPNKIRLELEHYVRIERGQKYVIVQPNKIREKEYFISNVLPFQEVKQPRCNITTN